MTTALVTGATGMLGSYIVDEVLRSGWRTRVLVRDRSAAHWLADLGAECIAGDIRDAESVARAAHGCDVVFHAAAEVGPRGNDERYRLTNVVGTANVIDATIAAGARLVHISSTAVYSRATRLRFRPTSEDVERGPLDADDSYGQTKLAAENLVLAAAGQGRLWATVVRPPPIYGRRDRQIVPRFAPVLSRGIFPLIDGGRATMTAVFAGSVADGAMRAATADIARARVYNLTNDVDVTVAEFVRYAGDGLGRRVLTPSISYRTGGALMRALAGALWIAGRRELVPHMQGLLLLFGRDNPFTSERARQELGWAPTPRPEVVIPEAFRWWREHGGSRKSS